MNTYETMIETLQKVATDIEFTAQGFVDDRAEGLCDSPMKYLAESLASVLSADDLEQLVDYICA